MVLPPPRKLSDATLLLPQIRTRGCDVGYLYRLDHDYTGSYSYPLGLTNNYS